MPARAGVSWGEFLEREGIFRAGLSGDRPMKGELNEDGSTSSAKMLDQVDPGPSTIGGGDRGDPLITLTPHVADRVRLGSPLSLSDVGMAACVPHWSKHNTFTSTFTICDCLI